MKNFKQFVGVCLLSVLLISCEKEEVPLNEESLEVKSAELTTKAPKADKTKGFVHGIIVEVDGEDFYFAGAPDGSDGSLDVPGHYWVMAGKDKLVGKHYNTGPFGAPQWWSSDADDGAYLYKVDAIIDEWTHQKAEDYAAKGFVHYHEFVSVEDGSLHPSKVVWLKHIARTSFTLDGGPMPEMSHEVTPGIDWEFMPNYSMPYEPEEGHEH